MWKVPSLKRKPAPDNLNFGEKTCRLVKWTIPSLPRSRLVVSDGKPPVRLWKKLLSRRRTHALAVPTTWLPLLFGSGHDPKVGDNIDDAEAGDQISLHRA